MWQKASENIPPLDGRPVLWLHRDGSGALVCMYINGMWWEVDDEQWHTPWDDMDGLKDCYWCEMPSGLTIWIARRFAEQYDYIEHKRNQKDTEPKSPE